MKILVIGGDGMIGKSLTQALRDRGNNVLTTSRKGTGDIDFDLMNTNVILPSVDAVFFCEAMTRFIECEDDERAYSCNVDAPIEIAKIYRGSLTSFVYLSSEAVERCLHTNYGMMKALAEMGLRAVCNPVIARLSKVTPDTVENVSRFLIGLLAQGPGIYRWPNDPR